jgi:prefoldin subunit 5
MNSYDNIRHDLSDASFSVTTAIELLDGIKQDGSEKNPDLHALITRLEQVRDQLDGLRQQVTEVERQIPA